MRRLGAAAKETPLVEGTWRPNDSDEGSAFPPTGPNGMHLDRSQFYQTARTAGLAYGPLFQRVADLAVSGPVWSAELAAPESAVDATTERALMWDALLQGGAVLAGGGTECWVPFSIERVRLLRNPSAAGRLGRLVGRWPESPAAPLGRRIANVRGFLAEADAPAVEFLGIHYGRLPAANGAAANGAASLETGGAKQILQRLRATPPEGRQALLIQFIEEQLLEVLKWPAQRRSELPRGLVEIGLDSLMAVDIQFRLQTALQFALKPGQTLNLPSIKALADFLLQKYLHSISVPRRNPGEPGA